MDSNGLTDQEFALFQKLIYRLAGINMADSKKPLVAGRLARRLRHYGLDSFGAYYKLVTSGDQPSERQLMVDLLTTNETYFFREAAHFDFLQDFAASRRGTPVPGVERRVLQRRGALHDRHGARGDAGHVGQLGGRRLRHQPDRARARADRRSIRWSAAAASRPS
ncbi:hypothetical protein MASR2M50_06950 [Thauera sp.]